MKASILYLATFCASVVSARVVKQSADPELPDLGEIFMSECAGSILSSCPEAVEAAQPYIEDPKKEFDVETIVSIAEKVKGNQACVDALPPCAGKVVEVSLRKLLGANQSPAENTS